MCWTGFTCLWSGYLQWKWNNENSPSEESHFFTALPGCNTARRAGQEQNGVCQVRFKLDLLSLARCNHHTGVFVPARGAGQAMGAVRRKESVLFPALWLRTACPLQSSLSPPAFPHSTQLPIKFFKRNRMAIKPGAAVRKRWKPWACWEIYP